MSKNLRKCMKNFHLFCCVQNKSLRNSILCELAKDARVFEALYEIVDNIHHKNLDLNGLTQSQKKQLKKFEPIMRKIHCKPKSKVIRKKLVKQTGGWIQFVLPILTSVVSELVTNAVSKKSDTGTA